MFREKDNTRHDGGQANLRWSIAQSIGWGLWRSTMQWFGYGTGLLSPISLKAQKLTTWVVVVLHHRPTSSIRKVKPAQTLQPFTFPHLQSSFSFAFPCKSLLPPSPTIPDFSLLRLRMSPSPRFPPRSALPPHRPVRRGPPPAPRRWRRRSWDFFYPCCPWSAVLVVKSPTIWSPWFAPGAGLARVKWGGAIPSSPFRQQRRQRTSSCSCNLQVQSNSRWDLSYLTNRN